VKTVSCTTTRIHPDPKPKSSVDLRGVNGKDAIPRWRRYRVLLGPWWCFKFKFVAHPLSGGTSRPLQGDR
jgi:hypothetical protein